MYGTKFTAQVIVFILSLVGTIWLLKPLKRFGQQQPPSLENDTPYPKLYYRKKAEEGSSSLIFRILQIADIHLGEEEATDWGPEQDRKTWISLNRTIQAEGKDNIDLLVLSGDQITANNIDRNATAYYQLLAHHLSSYGIPFAMIMGNHEDMAFEYFDKDGNRQYQSAKTSRRQLVESLSSFPLSLTRVGPPSVFGVSNYWLDLWQDSTTIASRVVFMDSGGGTIPLKISQTQLDWFALSNQPIDLPVVAFCHIPTQEFKRTNAVCQGEANEGVDSLEQDAGLIPSLQAPGNVHFLAVGHNHGNDYCCATSSDTLHLCYGRHSGYGGYGRWERGARVYELEISNTSSFSWRSYVRLESGTIQDIYSPAL